MAATETQTFGVFVGRENEMATVAAAVEDALSGRGRLVLISGEPGIGKTRMAQELGAYAQLRGMQVLCGRCHEGGGAPAYWPWVQAVRAYVYERTPEDLRSEMGAGAPEIANVVSAVRERLADLPAPSRLEPEQERFRFFDSLTTFLKRASTQQPMLLMVDDLHWADVSSLLLLQFVVHEMEEARLVVVATYRDEDAHPPHPLFAALAALARSPLTRRLPLSGLPEAAVAQLIERAAGEKPSKALIATVVRQTDGNPFFIGEVVRWLAARGGLGEAARAGIGVPPSVREVIGRRLQGLSPGCRELLATAAVIGREFSLALLASVREETPEQTWELVEEAVAARIVTEANDEDGRFSFVHALIRETLYAELSPTRRRRLHQQVAKALETLHGARLDQQLPALAYHFAEGGSVETAGKAVDYALRAGDRAMKLTAYDEAVQYYERVVEALEPGEDEKRRAEVLLALGRAEFGCGKPLAEVRDRYLQAAVVARRLAAPQLLARAAIEYSTAPRFAGVVDQSRTRLLEEANEALAGDESMLHAHVASRLALDLASRAESPERVTSLSEEALAIARRHEDRDTLSQVLANVADAHWRPEDLPKRLAWLKELEALSHFGEGNDLAPALHLIHLRAFTLLGEPASFERAIEAYIKAAEKLRLPYYLQVAHHLRAMRATMSGRFAEVESDAQAAFDLIGTYHREHAQQVFGAQLCSLRREQGRIAELEPVIIAAVEREPRAPMWRIALAMLYCELGRTERARPELERINLADVRMEPNFWLVTIALLAEAVAAVGDVGRAGVLYEILQPYSTLCVASADAVVFLGAAGRYLGLLAATMGRWDDAIRHFEEALAINEALKAPPLVARTKYNYASMLLARNGAGDRARARALADGVVETARRLGMPLLLEQALALELNGRESNPTPMTADAVLRREDAFWTLGFAGSSGRLKDMKGLHYLAQLLRYPGRELHALDLVRTTEATASENLATARADGFEILDAEAKVAYRRRLAELREELDEAEEFNDSGRAERARLEIEAIGAQLSAAIGRGGRDRVSGSAAERARSTVTKRIKEALKRIAEVNVLLGDHFATRVKTGTFCVYIPDAAHPVRWELE